MPHLNHMADMATVELRRQEREKSREIGRIEFFGRRHLPKHRPELRFQLE
jgi:hypothetical protein